MEKKSLFIIEDETIIAHEMKSVLEGFDYDIAGVASSINEALPQIDKTKPDLVLMDIQLKGPSDGIEIAKEIYSTSNIPTIFVTAFTDAETIHRAKQSGAFAFITKPINYQILQTTIEFVLYKHETINQIQKSEARYFSIVNVIDSFIIRSSIDGQIHFANKAFLIFNNIAEKKILAHSIEKFIPDAKKQIKSLIQSLNSTDKLPHVFIQNFSTSSKHKYWIQWSIHGLHDIQNHLTELQWFGKDVTAFKIEETKLLGMNELLDREIQSRTNDLRIANLKQRELSMKLADAEKMATLGLFTSLISHEINNFLSNIFNKLFLLENQLKASDDSQKSRDYAVQIKQQLLKMSNLTQNILFYVKPKSFKRISTDLNRIIESAIENINIKILNEEIQIHFQKDKGLKPVQADPMGLEIVIKNLLQNALNSIKKKGNITVKCAPDNKNHVKLKIQDDGTGIKTKYLPKIFEPFFSTWQDKGGTGLGLLLCKKIIDEHQGEIEVDSTWGKGTTITIKLPVIK